MFSKVYIGTKTPRDQGPGLVTYKEVFSPRGFGSLFISKTLYLNPPSLARPYTLREVGQP
jgi:hypothetical protein